MEWKSNGTGFLIDKSGYIATNYHVVKEANEIEIEINSLKYPAKVIVSDKTNDLAILKIDLGKNVIATGDNSFAGGNRILASSRKR